MFSFTANDSILNEWKAKESGDIRLAAYVGAPTAIAKAYGENLMVESTSKTTTIAQIAVKNTADRQRAADFINCLVAFYNQDANDEKNEVAQKTADFIEDRIGIINQELGSTETQLADFKQKSGLTDLTSDAKLALEENSKYEQLRIENQTQIRLVEFLRDYINNPANEQEVIPANVGLQDQNLSSVIDQYNTMLIERKRLLRTSSENNPAVINMNTGIEAMRHNVQTTVASVLKGLQITRSDIDRQARKFEGRISSAPQQEKEFLTISRQQEIKAQLYIMLLQKREENAITLAATATNGRIIEEAQADQYPVSPKKKVIVLAALIIGLGIPVGFVYLRDLLKYKIENRDDVEKLTTVPILGELPRGKKPEHGAIVVRENKNDIMEETFRGLRTNLLFMLGKTDKVILFSSTQPGEGKSFVAGNTAVSFRLPGQESHRSRYGYPQARSEQGVQSEPPCRRYHQLPERPRPCETDRHDPAPGHQPESGHPAGRTGTSQPDRAGSTHRTGRCHQPAERTLRLRDTRYRPHRYGDRYRHHRPCGRHLRICMPCRRNPESRLPLYQCVARRA